MSDPIARLLALGGELTTRRKFDLAHMRTLLHALGNPQEEFASVLIAGTNGKGSVAATLAAILQAAGHRTGLYTSPHLVRVNERIRINGALVLDNDLGLRFEQVEQAAARLTAEGALPHAPSFFEAVTATAFLHFAASGTAVAVLEAGLGGRLDATNVVDPLASVLTDISLDHQEWLGATIAAITREKCGILRPGGLMITLPQHPEANQTIGEIAVPLGVQAVNAVEYLPPRGTAMEDPMRNRYQVACPPSLGGGLLDIDSPLAGGHQQRNVALAIAAAVSLHEQKGFSLTKAALEQGVRATRWPGRLQLLRKPGAPTVLLDAAHNPAGAWALRAALASLDGPEDRRTLVFGCMQDKAVDELAQILFSVFSQVIVTRADTTRAAEPARLRQAAERTGTPCMEARVAPEALAAALAGTPENGLICIAGSIALLGECLPLLQGWS